MAASGSGQGLGAICRSAIAVPQWGHPQEGSSQSTLASSAQLMALDPSSSPCGRSLGAICASTTQFAMPDANQPPLATVLAAPNVPAPFLTKTYDLVDDPNTNTVISWSIEGNSFVVWNSPELCQRLLPRYFKHNNFSSFVRQLNIYGFRKIDPERWEFANDEFQRGKKHLLRGIHRRKPAASALTQQHHDHHSGSSSMFPSGSVVEFGVDGEIERLKRDKNVLMMEVMCLRQQLQSTEENLDAMWQRLQTTETCQQHMVSFIAKAIHNPGFLAQLMQQSSAEIAEITPKRRRLREQSTASISDNLDTAFDTTNKLKLHSGNEILNPNQHPLSVRGMEAESSMRVEANKDEMQLVHHSFKTLDELVEESSMMRSAAMSFKEHNGGIAGFMQSSSSIPRTMSQSNSTCGPAPYSNIQPYNYKSSPAVSTCGEQPHSSYNLNAEARSSRLLDQHYMHTSSSSQAEHYYEHDIGVSALRSSVRFNTQYSAGTLQEGISATKHVHAAHQNDLYHAVDGPPFRQYGPPLRQYDKYRAAEGRPPCQYDHYKAADGLPTYRAADSPLRGITNPSYWGDLWIGGLGTATAPQQARHAPDPFRGEAQGHQIDTSKNIDPIRWMRDL